MADRHDQPAAHTGFECEPAPPQPMSHNVRRMLQALDAYWLHCDGLPPKRYPRGRYEMEDWWMKFEQYRAKVEAAL